jgi:16S rRNA C1402 N4-methylase RsmH
VEYADFSEKYVDWIAKELVQHKKAHPFQTTHDVRDWAKNLGINDKKFAVIFQSWRIHINNELEEFDKFLEVFVDYLTP